DRVWDPPTVLSDGDKIEREAPEHALFREPVADLRRLRSDHRRVPGVGREAAAHERLPARPAEQLVVRREQLDLAQRRYPQLDARAPELVTRDQLLDDAAGRPELRQIRIERDGR